MNLSYLINNFKEIKQLSPEKQIETLEKSRYCAFTELGLNSYFVKRLVASVVIVLAFHFFLIFVAEQQFASGILVNLGLIPVSIFLIRLVYRKIYANLIYKGLIVVLNIDKEPHE